MFEKYYSTLENTEGYSQAALNRYNSFLENKLAELGLDPFRDYLELDEQVKNIGEQYLTGDPKKWPF